MSASRNRGNQARTKGNVPAPRTKRPPSVNKYVGRAVSISKRGNQTLTGTVRSYKEGVKKFLVTFHDTFDDGKSIPFTRTFYDHDLINSIAGEITQSRRDEVHSLIPGNPITAKVGGTEITGTVTSVSVVHLCSIAWGDGDKEFLESDKVDSILIPLPEKELETILEELPDGEFKVKWKGIEEYEIVQADKLDTHAVWEYRNAHRPESTGHPKNPSNLPAWKQGKPGMLLPQPAPKFDSRLIPDIQEKQKERNNKTVVYGKGGKLLFLLTPGLLARMLAHGHEGV
mmetsp:Transcript_8356/g.17255  ORF Transcript_8356/g.17255 Transcript_8356/m.17255 type:complete len:285 (+) Transcript_8356:498-1352(+)